MIFLLCGSPNQKFKNLPNSTCSLLCTGRDKGMQGCLRPHPFYIILEGRTTLNLPNVSTTGTCTVYFAPSPVALSPCRFRSSSLHWFGSVASALCQHIASWLYASDLVLIRVPCMYNKFTLVKRQATF